MTEDNETLQEKVNDVLEIQNHHIIVQNHHGNWRQKFRDSSGFLILL